MKCVCVSIGLLFSVMAVSGGSHAQGEFPVLEGPYMGQNPPGKTAEVFAPGVISTEGWELEAIFAPRNERILFCH